ncbi:hypothetical protein QAD02_009708, partial [Eretmocerus hayati]
TEFLVMFVIWDVLKNVLSEHTTPLPEAGPSGIPQNHYQRETESLMHTRLSCSACDEVFDSNYKLFAHMRIHEDNNKPFSCDVCGETFIKNQRLSEHVRCRKRFFCDFCGKGFARWSNCIEHLRLHTHEKPFSCRICKRKFSRLGSVENHVETHNNQITFSCNQCDRCSSGEPCRRFIQLEQHRVVCPPGISIFSNSLDDINLEGVLEGDPEELLGSNEFEVSDEMEGRNLGNLQSDKDIDTREEINSITEEIISLNDNHLILINEALNSQEMSSHEMSRFTLETTSTCKSNEEIAAREEVDRVITEMIRINHESRGSNCRSRENDSSLFQRFPTAHSAHFEESQISLLSQIPMAEAAVEIKWSCINLTLRRGGYNCGPLRRIGNIDAAVDINEDPNHRDKQDDYERASLQAEIEASTRHSSFLTAGT